MSRQRQKVSGVYLVRCIPTGNVYVGSSVDIRNRWDAHRSDLRRGRHRALWQQDWTEHGQDVFEFLVLEQCDKVALYEREQFYINELQPAYNGLTIAGGRPDDERQELRNKRISSSLRASKKLKAHHERRRGVKRPGVSAKMRGRRFSAEHAAKISAAQKGVRKPQASHALKTSPASVAFHERMRGSRRSAETRARMSAAMRGNANGLGAVHSSEAVARSRAAHVGVKRSVEARAKLSASHVGKPQSLEQRAYRAAMREGRDAANYMNDPAWRAASDEERAKRQFGNCAG